MDSDSDSSSDSEGWIDVASDGDLEISDSEDEKPTEDETKDSTTIQNVTDVTSSQGEEARAPRVSTLATTKVKLLYDY